LADVNQNLSLDLQRILKNKSNIEEENILLRREIDALKRKTELNGAPPSGIVNNRANSVETHRPTQPKPSRQLIKQQAASAVVLKPPVELAFDGP